MNTSDRLPDITNAMEWSSGRIVLHGSVDFEFYICRSGIVGGPELPLPHLWYSIRFQKVVSFAKVEMSLMWQYYTGDETTPPLLAQHPYDGDRTFVDGFTVNTESHGNSLKYYRIVTQDDVIDVISNGPPTLLRMETGHFTSRYGST